MRNLLFLLLIAFQLQAQETTLIFVSPPLTSFNDSGKMAVTYSSPPYLAEVTGTDTVRITDSLYYRWFISCDSDPNAQFEMLETHEDTIYLSDNYWKVYSTADHFPKTATTFTPILEVNSQLAVPFVYEITAYENPSPSRVMRLHINSSLPYKAEYFNHLHHFPLGGWYTGATTRRLWVYHRGIYYLRVKFQLPCGQVKEIIETLYFNP